MEKVILVVADDGVFSLTEERLEDLRCLNEAKNILEESKKIIKDIRKIFKEIEEE